MKKRTLLLVLALVASLALAVTGTLAYLTDTDSDVNVMTLGNVEIDQIELEPNDEVADDATLADGDLTNFQQGQALYPAYAAGDNAYEPQSGNLVWGDYVTADNEAVSNLWDDALLTGALDKFVFVENTGNSPAYFRTWIALECPDSLRYDGDTLADADGAGAQNDDLLPVGDHGLVLLLVGGVEVGDVAVELCGAGVDDLVAGEDVVCLTEPVHLDVRHAPLLADPGVGEAHALGFLQDFEIALVGLDHGLIGHHILDLVQEEHVDLGGAVDVAQVAAPAHQLGDGEEPVVLGDLDIAHQVGGGLLVELLVVDVVDADLQTADALQEGLLHGAADGHDLAGGLHLGGQAVVGGGELVEGEAGQLGDDIVDAGLEGGGGGGDHDLVQGQTHGHLGGDPGDGVAGGLGGQGGGAGDSGVDLDEVVFEGVGIQGELDVAAAGDLQLPDDLQGRVLQHVVFLAGEGLAGGDDHGVAGVDAHGVDVLHGADGDGGVVGVTHDLELDLLVALDGLLHQDLVDRGELQTVGQQGDQLLLVVGEAAAGAAQGEGRTQDDRIADLIGGLDALLQGGCDLRGADGLAQLLAQLLEQLPVLGTLDGLKAGAQDLHLALLQDALAGQLHSQVQAGLAAQAGDDGVGTLLADDAGDILQVQGLHIHLVGDVGVAHDGGGVGVQQDHLVALFLQGQAGLGAGVVKLGGLADDDGAGADDHNLLQIGALCHKKPSMV